MSIQLAGCVIVNDSGEILLLHRQADAYDHWEVPGGKVESGEQPAEAAERELREELGLEVYVENELARAEFVDRQRQFSYHYFVATTDQVPRVMEPQIFSEYAYHSPKNLAGLSLSKGAEQLLVLLETDKIKL